jgi:hypothetical protein
MVRANRALMAHAGYQPWHIRKADARFGGAMTNITQNDDARSAAPRATALAYARSKLDSPAAPLWLGALAFLMSLPSLSFGLQGDDHVHARSLLHGLEPLQMLQLPPDAFATMVQDGQFAWWTSPQLSVRFLRPLASLTHWIEFSWWPDATWAMHLTNILSYAALVAIAAATYREILGRGAVSALAGLMFTFDGGHGSAAGWIASRNTLLATLFALLSILLHARSRTQRRLALGLASAASTALALSSAEYGVAALAYLVAYACVLDSGGWGSRARSLIPNALVGLVWAAVYVSGQYGFRHGGWYRDPSSDPLGVIGFGLADLPVWFLSQLAMNIAEFTIMADPGSVAVVAAVLVSPLLAWLYPSLRESPHARFFALGMWLSILPLFTTHPQGRLLIAPSFGALGWIACAITQATRATGVLQRTGRRVMRALHLVVAPMLFMLMLGQLVGVERSARALADNLPAEGGRDAVIINLPIELLTQFAWCIREELGAPPLNSLHQLYAGDAALELTRIDDRTLDITASRGWGRTPFQRLFSSKGDLPGLGSTRSPRGLQATVLEVTPDGRPLRVRFAFTTALEADQRRWLVWRGNRPRPFVPPAVGTSVAIAPVTPFDFSSVSER